MKTKLLACKFYLLALDESTGLTDTAQLTIFICGINDELKFFEEMLALCPLKGTTKGTDILNATKTTLARYHLSLKNLAGFATDGAPAMVGTKVGLVALLKKEQEIDTSRFTNYHCIIHQENLCAKSLAFENVMKVITDIVNFIQEKGLNHRQFQNFLQTEWDADHGDVVYFSDMRWLSRSKVLMRIFELKDAIQEFMTAKGKPVLEFDDPKWLAYFAFLMDISSHLNELNLKLQSKDQLVHVLFNHIKAFQMKLKLFKCQLQDQNLTHFQRMLKLQSAEYAPQYVAAISQLQTEFQERFQDFRAQERTLNVVTNPFSVIVMETPGDLQMEIIDLQCDSDLKIKFDEVSLLEFYQQYVEMGIFVNLRMYVARIFSLFGSTYLCEQMFSRMKHSQVQIEEKITDCHQEHCLLLATTEIVPNIELLLKK
jgi:hypothetical protein